MSVTNTSREFEVGELVFAKLRGFVPWPSRIEAVKENPVTHRKKYEVFFFGTYQTARVGFSALTWYSGQKEQFVDKRKFFHKKHYDKALWEIENNPTIRPPKPKTVTFELFPQMRRPRGRPRNTDKIVLNTVDSRIRRPVGRPRKAGQIVLNNTGNSRIRRPVGRPRKAGQIVLNNTGNSRIRRPVGRPRKVDQIVWNNSGIRRPVGRPRKVDQIVWNNSGLRRPVGRPRKVDQIVWNNSGIRRPVGRPRKVDQIVLNSSGIRRPVGRPRKVNQIVLNNTANSRIRRPVGRPRKVDQIVPNNSGIRRPVGRPRKANQIIQNNIGNSMIKRPVGRPRKTDRIILYTGKNRIKRPVGRPRKTDRIILNNRIKRPVGRPRKTDFSISNPNDGREVPEPAERRGPGRPRKRGRPHKHSLNINEQRLYYRSRESNGMISRMSGFQRLYPRRIAIDKKKQYIKGRHLIQKNSLLHDWKKRRERKKLRKMKRKSYITAYLKGEPGDSFKHPTTERIDVPLNHSKNPVVMLERLFISASEETSVDTEQTVQENYNFEECCEPSPDDTLDLDELENKMLKLGRDKVKECLQMKLKPDVEVVKIAQLGREVVELEREIKSSLNTLDIPRCVHALNELEKLAVNEFVLKKEPEIITTLESCVKCSESETVRHKSVTSYVFVCCICPMEKPVEPFRNGTVL